ncbi:MAG: hypothetical protein QNJ97_05925 [Myxococcota bacterium]|nr:hypothetical protein [Myxococcota bacterium]
MKRHVAIVLSILLVFSGIRSVKASPESFAVAAAWLGKKVAESIGNKIYDKTVGKVVKDVFITIFGEEPDPLRDAVSMIVTEIDAVRADMHDLFTQDIVDAARGLEYSLDELLDLIMLEQPVDIELSLMLRDAADIRASLEGIILHGVVDLEQQTFDFTGENEYWTRAAIRVARAYNNLMPVIAFLRLLKGHSDDLVEEPFYEVIRTNRALINYRRCFSTADISCEGPLLRVRGCKFGHYYTFYVQSDEDYLATKTAESNIWAASRAASDFIARRTSQHGTYWYTIGSYNDPHSGELTEKRYCLTGVNYFGGWILTFDDCENSSREMAWTTRHFRDDRIQILHAASNYCLGFDDVGPPYAMLRPCSYGDSWHVNHFVSIFSMVPLNKAIDTNQFTLIKGEHEDKPLFIYGCSNPIGAADFSALYMDHTAIWPTLGCRKYNICDIVPQWDERWWFDSRPYLESEDLQYNPITTAVLILSMVLN